MTSRTPFRDLPRPQQAGILCNDPQFQLWVGGQRVTRGTRFNASACAEHIRTTCGIASRRDLTTNPDAATRFDAMLTDFHAAIGRIGTPQERS